MTYNGFEYNDWGSCLNPETPYRFGKWNQCNFEIKVSETPRGWIYGYRWATTTKGGGGGCYIGTLEDASPTKPEAIVAAAEYIKSCFGKDPKAAKVIAELDRIISEESKPKPKIKQLTIFDYLHP